MDRSRGANRRAGGERGLDQQTKRRGQNHHLLILAFVAGCESYSQLSHIVLIFKMPWRGADQTSKESSPSRQANFGLITEAFFTFVVAYIVNTRLTVPNYYDFIWLMSLSHPVAQLTIFVGRGQERNKVTTNFIVTNFVFGSEGHFA